MDCPYIIRENIGFGRVREHGYYQLDEMAYDLTHDFAQRHHGERRRAFPAG